MTVNKTAECAQCLVHEYLWVDFGHFHFTLLNKSDVINVQVKSFEVKISTSYLLIGVLTKHQT